VDVIEIEGPEDERAIEQFHQVAARVYEDDPVWVPGSERTFTQRFRGSQGQTRMTPIVALENDLPLARAVAILAPGATDQDGQPQGWIGFFECLKEHPHAARRVLERCEKILQQAGAGSVLVPKADNQLVGLLIEGFHLPHTVFTHHNPPHYLGLLENCGYEIKTTMYTLRFTRESAAEQVHVELPGFSTREFDRDHLADEIVVFHKLQRAIFGGRPGYVLRTLEQDRAMVQSFLSFLQDDLVIIAEDSAGQPVGLLVCLPDVYQALRGQEINRVRIVSIGAIPSLRHKGIGALMGAHLMRNLLRRKEYVSVEGSWILGSNVSPRNLARRFNAEPGREFALLEKKL
jgi:GNAT superfamily N-acetyltransferase